MNRAKVICLLTMFLLPAKAKADLLMIDKAPDSVFSTGANFDAIAGGLSFGTFDIDSISPTVLPHMSTLSASMSGATATHVVHLEPDFSAGPAFFDSSFTGFARTGIDTQRATAEGHIEFKVDALSTFLLDGFFSVDDVGSSSGVVELEAHLVDITLGATHPSAIFSSYQLSKTTTDQTFMIGGMGGDDTNALLGTPMGILEPGKRYALIYLANSLATSSTTDAATASGAISFKVVSSVPEPGIFQTLLAGCLVLLGWRRTRGPKTGRINCILGEPGV
ncbi:MAG: hypothetical protein KDB03_19085 [Planctomycetales bacterium]|nr:hypothetical protein [Planctomycetales bacterium]